MTLAITHGLDEAHRAAAADLYWQAFGGKLGPVMGPPARARRYIESVLQLGQCFSAVHAGELVGIVGYAGQNSSFAGGTSQDFRRVYGWASSLWRLPLLTLVGNGAPVSIGIMAVDGFCVAPSYRGQGIGAQLLDAACAYASDAGYHALQLEVVNGNWRAKAFYLRHGFQVSGQRSIGALRYAFGFAGTVTMLRDLPSQTFPERGPKA